MSATPPRIDDSGPSPVVRGSDIKVSQIAAECEFLGLTPDEVVQAHPHIGLADVHSALTYYYDHMDRIRAEWQEADSLVASLRDRFPSRLAARLR